MHVDGGATELLILVSPEVPMTRVDRALGYRGVYPRFLDAEGDQQSGY